MAIFRETLAVGAESVAQRQPNSHLQGGDFNRGGGVVGVVVFAQGPSTPSEREGERRNAGADVGQCGKA